MILHLNPSAGVSGDMLLGALLDLGAPLDDVRRILASTGVRGWRLTQDRVAKHGIMATAARVEVEDDTATSRTAAELIAHAARVDVDSVALTAQRALRAVAEVEARLHGTDPDHVHLHELGGLDTIVDIVGSAAAMHLLGVERVVSAPVGLGQGRVSTQHGWLPAPAPATMALLRGASVVGIDVPAETVTPTGAALLTAIDTTYGPFPAGVVGETGYGAGTRDLPDRPNVLQATLLETATDRIPPAEELVVLETNVDDATGEVLGHLVGAAMDAGAADAWITPAVMKKNRPAHVVHVLCRETEAAMLEELVLRHTGSLGIRRSPTLRRAVPRRVTTVDVGGHPVRVKHGPWHAKPEHDDVVAAADALGVPPLTVASRVRRHLAGRPGTAPPEPD
ncbi:nickel pincer cofactor biosynthesis protein LarC [Spiractinospora alimapuensis]|uniref:nickel pincer cofactor biosynthesis protein LarC n=1 Tax=Spiractinospora alimapuensis TaxID=2820884 RepID=UPI001F2BC733|nr:nickel pincer cofactor biosynthesis protein LarC [Spiractinospora alimapuensis]QVQ52643.1 nickel pincer cofactor biosynthesis protein LarC [Spiractinospora alimapuensis]